MAAIVGSGCSGGSGSCCQSGSSCVPIGSGSGCDPCRCVRDCPTCYCTSTNWYVDLPWTGVNPPAHPCWNRVDTIVLTYDKPHGLCVWTSLVQTNGPTPYSRWWMDLQVGTLALVQTDSAGNFVANIAYYVAIPSLSSTGCTLYDCGKSIKFLLLTGATPGSPCSPPVEASTLTAIPTDAVYCNGSCQQCVPCGPGNLGYASQVSPDWFMTVGGVSAVVSGPCSDCSCVNNSFTLDYFPGRCGAVGLGLPNDCCWCSQPFSLCNLTCFWFMNTGNLVCVGRVGGPYIFLASYAISGTFDCSGTNPNVYHLVSSDLNRCTGWPGSISVFGGPACGKTLDTGGCCAGIAVPRKLYATITNMANCATLDGKVVELDYQGSGTWLGTFPSPCATVNAACANEPFFDSMLILNCGQLYAGRHTCFNYTMTDQNIDISSCLGCANTPQSMSFTLTGTSCTSCNQAYKLWNGDYGELPAEWTNHVTCLSGYDCAYWRLYYQCKTPQVINPTLPEIPGWYLDLYTGTEANPFVQTGVYGPLFVARYRLGDQNFGDYALSCGGVNRFYYQDRWTTLDPAIRNGLMNACTGWPAYLDVTPGDLITCPVPLTQPNTGGYITAWQLAFLMGTDDPRGCGGTGGLCGSRSTARSMASCNPISASFLFAGINNIFCNYFSAATSKYSVCDCHNPENDCNPPQLRVDISP